MTPLELFELLLATCKLGKELNMELPCGLLLQAIELPYAEVAKAFWNGLLIALNTVAFKVYKNELNWLLVADPVFKPEKLFIEVRFVGIRLLKEYREEKSACEPKPHAAGLYCCDILLQDVETLFTGSCCTYGKVIVGRNISKHSP